MTKRLTKEEFIERARQKYGTLYDYSLVDYKNCDTPVKIICPKHGIVEQTPYRHIAGRGCPKCFATPKLTTDEFISQSKKVHGDKYDYSLVEYRGTMHPVKIICPEHGIFEQIAITHKGGHGCPKCAKKPEVFLCTTDKFIKKAILKHGDKYDYSLVEYTGVYNKVDVICHIHGKFSVIPNAHLNGQGCPKCSLYSRRCGKPSSHENAIASWFANTFEQHNRTIIKPKELDLVSHEYRLAIEVNGAYWHSTKYLDKTYHLDKTNQVEANGYKLLHFWDFEIIDKPELVKSMIAAKIGKNVRVFARKCRVDTITAQQARLFEEENHLQGAASSESVRYGLVHNNELVALMTFGKSRFDKKYDWELIRYCCLKGHTVVGGASKLFKHFLKNHSGSVMSYANRRISDGGLYKKLGFNEVTRTGPNYFWFNANGGIRYTRQKCQKHKLASLLEDNFNPAETEYQNMTRNGFVQCFDSGNIKYEYSIQD
nr:MAG TPA: endonuclease-like protein [Caudoviricetes sp.]